jgi:hypothetical protein
MLAEAIVRRFSALKTLGEATAASRLTGFLSLAGAQVEAERQERCRAGRQFRAMGYSTGTAPVQGIATSAAAALVLWNNDANRSYIIDTIEWYLLSGTSTAGVTTLAMVAPITATLPTNATGVVVANTSMGGLVSKAVFGQSYTSPAPSGMQQWGVVSTTGQLGVVGGVWSNVSHCDVRGGIIIPPGKAMYLQPLAGVGASPLYVPGVSWTEAELDLE